MKHVILRVFLLSALLILTSCATKEVKKEQTVGDIASSAVDYPLAGKVSQVDPSSVIEQYKEFLKKAKSKENYAAALRRIADLELEQGDATVDNAENKEIEVDVKEEKDNEVKTSVIAATPPVVNEAVVRAAKLSSIKRYESYLKAYPSDKKNDNVTYQLAKAYSYVGEMDKALLTMDIVITKYPNSRHIDEVQFRRGEILFVNRDFAQAEKAYADIVLNYKDSILYEKALYKLGWSQFKQERYKETLKTYLSLLDIKEAEKKIDKGGISAKVSNSEKDFIFDSLRVLSLSLSYLDSYNSIPSLFKSRGKKLYLPLIYKELGKLFIKKERFNDAADTYMAFTKTYPQSEFAASFHTLALDTYKEGHLNDKVLDSKMLYVKNYGMDSKYWKTQGAVTRERIRPELMRHTRELAKHFHAQARKTKKPKDFNLAATWYKNFIKSFPESDETPSLNFLYAEALYDAGNYSKALAEYEKTAYDYPPHRQNAEAAYAALLTYNVLLKQAKLKKQSKKLASLRQQSLDSSVRFSDAFPNDKNAPAVITKSAENLFEAKKYSLASVLARRMIDKNLVKRPDLLQTSWIVYAHSQYELGFFDEAEKAYISAIKTFSKASLKKNKKNIKLKAGLTDKLAASIYKQAEGFKKSGEKEMAATYFLRVGKVAPTSAFRATAEYDAATLYMGMSNWVLASKILENMRRSPATKGKFKEGISSKLLLVYTEMGQFDKAAVELGVLTKYAKTPGDKRNIVWQTAEMYEKAGKIKKANDIYMKYIAKYPKPFMQSMEAYEKVSAYYLAKNATKSRKKWLNKLIKAEKRGGRKRTDRTRYLAANAVYEMAQPSVAKFKRIKLKIPLKKSLRKKKKRMKTAIAALKKVMTYNVAELTTAATYQMGEIYNNLSSSLMTSQRPKGLSVDEIEQYDILLEEQAFPFEEKAADIHSLNAKRTKSNIYDKWVKKSLSVLKNIQPIRYGKSEKVESYALITH